MGLATFAYRVTAKRHKPTCYLSFFDRRRSAPSRFAWRNVWRPGMPFTPPPAWVPLDAL